MRRLCIHSVALQAIGYASVEFAYRVPDDEMTHLREELVVRAKSDEVCVIDDVRNSVYVCVKAAFIEIK